MKFGANIDLNKNQIMNMVNHKLAAAPSNPVEGQDYYNTVDHRKYTWNNTSWVPNDGQGATMTGDNIIAAINSSTAKIDDDNLSTAVNSAITNAHTHANKALLDTYTQTEANLADAVSKKHTANADTGTTSATFSVGSSGVKIKNNGGTELQVRNNADTAYADLRVKNLYVEGPTTEIVSDILNIGDSEITLNNDITTSATNSDGGIAVKRLMADNTTRKDAKMIYNNSIGRWQSIQGDVANVLATLVVANKAVAAIGDGAATSYVVTHNLNTRDCIVGLRETNAPYAEVWTDAEHTTLDTVTIKFAVAPTSNQYTVTIIG